MIITQITRISHPDRGLDGRARPRHRSADGALATPWAVFDAAARKVSFDNRQIALQKVARLLEARECACGSQGASLQLVFIFCFSEVKDSDQVLKIPMYFSVKWKVMIKFLQYKLHFFGPFDLVQL